MTSTSTTAKEAWEAYRAGRTRDAERFCLDVLAVDHKQAEALQLLALLRQQERRYPEAAELLRRAIRASPQNAALHNNLGTVLGLSGELGESIVALRESIRLRPDYADAHGNLAISLVRALRIPDAIKAFRVAASLAPTDAAAHVNLARALLLTGRFEEGFAEYEWRLRDDPGQYSAGRFPSWDGTPLNGKTILLRAEQGLGDTIHFVRYASLLVECGARRVVIDCQSPLRSLLNCLTGPVVELFDVDRPNMEIDVETRLLSLPHLLGTTLDSVPASVPYLHAEVERASYWRVALPDRKAGLRVAITWQGSPTFHSDRQRSAPLAAFEPLAKVRGVKLISLQKGFGSEQLVSFSCRDCVLDVTAQLEEGPGRAFTDTAAVLANCELLITTDTAMAHLAGALGIPVWVALPHAPDWRWLLDRNDSPWYPTMRLFRQQSPGDWASVFDRMAAELKQLGESPTEQTSATISIGAGELADRLTILRIRCDRLAKADEHVGLHEELIVLETTWKTATCPGSVLLDSLLSSLEIVNRQLWQIEDELRQCESAKEFNPLFVERARSVYRLNDHRSRLKRRIDDLLGSKLTETKVFASAAPPKMVTYEARSATAPSPHPRPTTAPNGLEDAIRSFERGQHIRADRLARQVLVREPENARAVHIVGLVAHKTGDQPTAIEWMRRSITLSPSVAAFHSNLGEALRLSDRFEEALACYQEAARLRPDFAEAHFNMGIAHRYLGHGADALACNERAVALSPDDPEIHLNLGITRFLTGDLAGGFAEYEWRWKAKSFGSPAWNFSQPQWDGREQLRGKTVLVHAEQGFGDTIQFCRYMPLLVARGASVLVEVQPEVKRLLGASLSGACVIARGEPLGQFDYHCPMLSLPKAFGTTIDSVPADVPYLKADASQSAEWSRRLRDNGRGGRRIGLVWAGRPTHKNDHHRSITLETLEPLADVAGVRWISLQQGPAAAQADQFPESGARGLRVERYRPLADFADTAALLANLDLLVAVDTAVAHLAGAMGLSVWMLNPFVCDWRWMLGRNDSPWYPSMRLFNQAKSGDWFETIQRLRDALSKL